MLKPAAHVANPFRVSIRILFAPRFSLLLGSYYFERNMMARKHRLCFRLERVRTMEDCAKLSHANRQIQGYKRYS